ncbi:bifunctional protein-serine/threonine kinase/phosphatase [Aidingimonas halophila]|uniref:Serine/threonine protein kinase n=1 Tax=Aidingimonas halophila TaxID=574349 RepID=A0A1H3FTQ7_9GAMM|nr:bifunctional protein-serine/threonine kinase/phosphatase [Aidingimonas halophila]GHC38402.1 protein kinase [Aidingimonas halophila]SDX93748.1 Serine/threonine protein kinase [Aidingimonas halophila]
MAPLSVSIGQYSNKGCKPINQDFYGAYIPQEPQLSSKGIAIALADGISSSDVSQIASETAVRSFLDDYYCTSEAWSVKKSAQRVLMATNSWLYAKTRQSRYRDDMDRGYVCTLSAAVIKSTTAHLFHVGDARIYRLVNGALEQLTDDHRVWVSRHSSHLSNALGIDEQLEIDYQALPLEGGDTFLFVTDGIHEYANARFMANAIEDHRDDLDEGARIIAQEAFDQGSTDNLTAQIIRVDSLPVRNAEETQQWLGGLPFPPELEPRMTFDGYEIMRRIHVSSRSHVFLAKDIETQESVALKTPASDLQQDPVLLERFLTEEWIARRINSPYVVSPCQPTRQRRYLYAVTEFIEGKTLTQWMRDHPQPTLEEARSIIEQIGKGLQAFHRQEMIHQDLRPDNVLIDHTGTIKLIDFGAARVAGIAESRVEHDNSGRLGTAQYSAPEYFIGDSGSVQSDIFSLGVIAYQMLSGRLPYGTRVAQTRTRHAQHKLHYGSVTQYHHDCPAWIDGVLKKALHPSPHRRYEAISEFLYDLRHPRQEFLNEGGIPLIDRHPQGFWKGLSLLLAIVVVILAILLLQQY